MTNHTQYDCKVLRLSVLSLFSGSMKVPQQWSFESFPFFASLLSIGWSSNATDTASETADSEHLILDEFVIHHQPLH